MFVRQSDDHQPSPSKVAMRNSLHIYPRSLMQSDRAYAILIHHSPASEFSLKHLPRSCSSIVIRALSMHSNDGRVNGFPSMQARQSCTSAKGAPRGKHGSQGFRLNPLCSFCLLQKIKSYHTFFVCIVNSCVMLASRAPSCMLNAMLLSIINLRGGN